MCNVSIDGYCPSPFQVVWGYGTGNAAMARAIQLWDPFQEDGDYYGDPNGRRDGPCF